MHKGGSRRGDRVVTPTSEGTQKGKHRWSVTALTQPKREDRETSRFYGIRNCANLNGATTTISPEVRGTGAGW